MAQSPQRIPDQNIIRTVKDVVNANADLLIISGSATDTGFSLTTEGGDEIPVDLTEAFVTREEFTNSTDVPLASEEQSGRVQLITTPEAIKAEDDSKAMTALKTLQLILSLGIPRFDIGDGQDGQLLLIEVIEGEVVIKPGSAATTLPDLIKKSSRAERNAAFKSFMESVDPMDSTQALFCRLGSQCVGGIAPVYNFTNAVVYQAKALPVTPLQPNYVIRFDVNNCDEYRGWIVDTNHPNVSPTVRIVRDGVVIATIVASIDRSDARNVLIGDGRLPQGSNYALYGWSYPKVASDKDGKSHAYEAFGGTSNTKATTDTGAPVNWTCGTTVVNPPVVDPPVVNPPVVNNPPRIAGVYVDQVVNVAGDYLLDSFAGLFADDDALTYRVTMGDGKPLDAGIVFTPGDAKPIKVQAGYPNQQRPMTIHARDTAGSETPKSFLLTVARPVIQVDPVTVVSRAFGGETEADEGNGARVKIVQTMSNGATSDYTGGGSYRIIPNYPDGMTITTDRDAVGVIATKETITADVPVTLEFTSTEGWTVTGPFTVRNKTVATSPIVSQLINDIRVIEGSGGTVQVYDVHADGNWTEVTQANGSKFELVAPYPNGMSISFSNTGRAQVQTAGNSISEDVPVTVRYTPASGPVVQGIITVVNQAPPTTENPTPDAKPYVEKFAVYIPAQNTNAVVDFLLKIVNVAVGTEIQIVWTEFNQRTNSAQDRYFASTIKDDPNSLPNGYKDYNLLNGLFFIPFSATQSHSVQHVRVRIKDASAYLFETTFDPYGLSPGQPKQFFPL